MQGLVSCETDCSGCNGGFPYKAMDWAAFFGMYTEASYPYASSNGTVPKCDVNGTGRVKAMVQATGHQLLNQTEEYVSARARTSAAEMFLTDCSLVITKHDCFLPTHDGLCAADGCVRCEIRPRFNRVG